MAEQKKKKPADMKAADHGSKSVAEAPVKRTSLIQFFQEVRREASKVTWPSIRETWLTTVMVFLMVGVTMVFFYGVDLLLSLGERYLIGAAG